MRRRSQIILGLSVAAASVATDRITKLLVYFYMAVGSEIKLIPNFFHLTHLRNDGAAFGMFGEFTWAISIITAAILAVLVVIMFRTKVRRPLFFVSLGLISGGGLGNLIDRVFFGNVIDFADFKAIYFICPAVFNFADVCVLAGCVLLFIYILFFDKKEITDGQ